MSKSLFDILKDLSYTKVPYDESIQYNKFMTNRFVSMCDAYIPLVQEVNRGTIPDRAHYNYFKIVLPKRNTFFKYIGKSKEEKQDIEVIEAIEKYFKVSRKDARSYYELLTEEVRNEIRELYSSSVEKTSVSKTKKKA